MPEQGADATRAGAGVSHPRTADHGKPRSGCHPFCDATEQRISRPQGRLTQRRYYAGTTKGHTLKNQVVVYRRPDHRPEIAAVSPSRHGSVHDKKIDDPSRMTNAKGITRDGDTGSHGTAMRTPHKKPKGGKLTDGQKAFNRSFSSSRVKVEHGIGGMKRFGLAGQRFRNPRRTHTILMKNVAGLATWNQPA